MGKQQESKGEIGWIVSYDGVPQHKKCFSETQEKAIAQAENVIKQLKWEVNNDKTKIYPDEDKWELRILND